ncbi:MAG: HoxN/HupN/NixA family nickel/cobalt transporter [Thermoplasmata archaeon]
MPVAERPSGFSRSEAAAVALLYAAIFGVTVGAFVAAFFVLPYRFSGEIVSGSLLFGGLAITAYFLGLKHGFDVDHIAAIDNTTRKLLQDGQRPLTVGTWFSIGHSTVVAGMIVALVAATEFVKSYYGAFAATGAVLGTLISGAFLFVIGLVNVLIVVGVYRIFRAMREGRFSEAELDSAMDRRGLLYRWFGRLFRVVRRPRDMYPIGVLFGLGFDTATEVLLISFSVGFAVTSAVPLWAVLLLPLLFACGMVLSDTSDGIAMRYAYGWAFLHPIRKVYYNLTLTVLSVLVAFVIGGVELLQVLSSQLGWTGPFWSGIQGLSFSRLGLAVAGLFVGAWLVALGIYRVKRIEETGLGGPPGHPS